MHEPALRILLVEDDADQCPIITSMLGEPHRVHHVQTARAAVQCSLQLEFDLVLLDLCLPDTEGLDALRQIKATRPAVPIIVLTRGADSAIAQEALSAGAQDFLHKPELTGPLLWRAIRYARERQQIENRLRESEARFRAMADVSPLFVWMTDSSGEVTFCNRAWLELVGANEQECRGEGWRQFVHPDDLQRTLAAFEDALRRQSPLECEYRVRRHDGEYRLLLSRGVPLRDLSGASTGYCGSCLDITEMRHAEELRVRKLQIGQELERSRLALQAMEQAIGVVSHELRAPIAGVRLLTECMLEGSAPHDCRDTVERIHALSNGMLETVESLLDSIRANSSRAPWLWEEFNLADACRAALDVVAPLMATTEVQVDWEVHSDAAAMRGDAGSIRRLLVNLLTNAYKHTRKGSIRIQVRAASDHLGDWRVIEVSDTGVGIPPHLLKQLGTPFTMGAAAFAHFLGGGVGLGLAICRSIASVHGGHLAVHSQEGCGTTMTVRIRADLEAPQTGASAAMELLAG